jgi:hypothetical protein
MASRTVSVPCASISVEEYGARPLQDLAEGLEVAESGSRPAQGAIIGILLGATLWAAILISFGVIKI